MRSIVPILAVLASLATPADAGIARVGRGIITSSAPPIYYVAPSPDDAGVSRMLYRKQDLAGLPPNVPITAIEFDKRLSGALATGALAIYMKNSAATVLPATSTVMDGLAGMTEVFTTTSPAIPAPSGWVRFTLTTPFTYTGDAIEVATVWDAMSGPRTEDLHFAMHGTGTVFLEQLNHGPAPLAATDVLGRSNPVTRVNTQFIFPDPVQGYLVVEVAKNPLQNGGTFSNSATFAAGTTVPVFYTLRNIGGTALTPTVVFTNLANMPMPAVTGVPATLAAGGSAVIRVEHTPIAANVATAYTMTVDTKLVDHTVTITGFAAPGPAQEIQVEFCDENQDRCSLVQTGNQIYVGNAVVGVPQNFELNIGSIGSLALSTPTGASSLGCDNCTLTFTEQCDASIFAGTDDVVKATVVPLAAGPWATTFRIANDDPTESTYQIEVRGLAVTPPATTAAEIAVSYAGLDVGSGTGVSSATAETAFTIGNVGDAQLEVSMIEVVAVTNTSAPVLSQTSMSIAPASQQQLTITSSVIDPTQPAGYRLRILHNDTANSPYEIDVALVVANIEVVYEPQDLHQGDPAHAVTFEIRNTGTGPLLVSAFTVAPSGVTVIGLTMTPFTIAPGGSQTITLDLELSADAIEWDIAMTIASNDRETPTTELALTGDIRRGTAADPGCFSASPSNAGPLLLAFALLLVRKPRRRRHRS